MELTVHLEDKSYPIYIEHNILDHLDEYLDPNRKYTIVTDSGVPQKWIEKAASQLPNSFVICFEQGESSKNIETWKEILTAMIQQNMNRKDALIALGGGVAGDMGGFAAACYMRGIDFYNIPTTVLSQVDSSVGGKVAVDLDSYKNIVGAFYQPKAVFIDPEVLTTLPVRHIHNGLMEALKMGCILDPKLISLFEEETLNIDEIIYRSIDLKRQIVEEDETEKGVRQILNFGHTIGHALESCYGLNTYLHGECVGMGMDYFIQDEDLLKRVQKIKEKLKMPTAPKYEPQKVLDFIRHDKKGARDFVTTVIVKAPGQWELEKTSYEQLLKILEDQA